MLIQTKRTLQPALPRQVPTSTSFSKDFFLISLISKQTHRYKRSLLKIWRLTSRYLYNISIIPHISTVVKKHFTDRSVWHIMTTSGIFLKIMEFIFLSPKQTWWNVAVPGVSVTHTFNIIASPVSSVLGIFKPIARLKVNGHTLMWLTLKAS